MRSQRLSWLCLLPFCLQVVCAQWLQDAAERPSVPAVQLHDGLPDTRTLSQEAQKSWADAIETLSEVAEARARSLTKGRWAQQRLRGLPGTAVNDPDMASSIQAHLDCMVSEGEWRYEHDRGKGSLLVHKQQAIFASCDKQYYKKARDDTTDWNVRDSLKWHWEPSSKCHARAIRSSRPSRRRFCELIAHKSILLVGDLTHYELHDLLLDYTTTEPASCYGSLYCSEHLLCSDILRKRIDDWSRDERVYERLPDPPLVLPNVPAQQDLLMKRAVADGTTRSVSQGTLLRFARSDGLRFAGPQTVSSYVHPYTGIREPNHKWLNDAHRSDVVVLTKPPIPMPLPGANAAWDEWFTSPAVRAMAHYARVIEAARRITLDVWLPELLDTLKAVRLDEAAPPDQLVLYRSRWLTHADCATSEPSPASGHASPGDGPFLLKSAPNLLDLLRLNDENEFHVAFYNAQVVLQNHLARAIAPLFGIAFLDFERILSVWRSGMVGSSESDASRGLLVDQASSHLNHGMQHDRMRSAASGDCHRYCLPNPALEEAWIGTLHRLFEAVWGGHEEWEGDKFYNVRQRHEREGRES